MSDMLAVAAEKPLLVARDAQGRAAREKALAAGFTGHAQLFDRHRARGSG